MTQPTQRPLSPTSIDAAERLKELPTRVAAIRENWAKLSHGPWDSVQLEAMYRRVHELSASAADLHQPQLNDSILSLEAYLSSFVDLDRELTTEQNATISALVHGLETSVAAISVATPLPVDEVPLAYVLGNDNAEPLTEVVNQLRRLGTEVRWFSLCTAMLDAMQEHCPSVLVCDTEELPQIRLVSDELAAIRQHQRSDGKVPLVFISRTSALQRRLEAMRVGGEAYFVAPMDSNEVAHQIVTLAEQRKPQPCRVMIVEDDAVQAEFAAGILGKAGMQVETVIDPLRVLDTLQTFRPDLILMDIYMPEINGIELTTIIREHRDYVAIPIVFLSGEQDAERQYDALSVGGDDFIAKPIRPKHLRAVVENRVMRARQLRFALDHRQPFDSVTGLLSRQSFLTRVAAIIEAQNQTGVPSAAILYLQPNDLPALRERLGLGTVDALFTELADLIVESLEHKDLACRIDDDSIAILVRRGGPQLLLEYAQSLQTGISAHPFRRAATPVELRVSIGVCLLDEEIENAQGLISRARKACAEAQQQGGKHLHVFGRADSNANGLSAADNVLANAIRNALQEQAFVCQYQPLLDLSARGSENYQLLIRLPTTQGDLLGGRQLYGPAESAGLLAELDHWTLEKAIELLAQRRTAGHPTHLFVRLSTPTILDPALVERLTALLRSYRVVGTGLVVDLGLNDLSKDLKAARDLVLGLRKLDIAVVISRFPDKPAAFKVLRFLRPQYLRISPRLLTAERNVISNMIEQAHSAKVQVIVSNIDDPRAIDLHWSSGADLLQGNFIQRPLESMDYDFTQVVI